MLELNANILFQVVLSVLGFSVVFIINGFKKSVDEMRHSIQDLNVNIASLVEKDLHKDKAIEDHRARFVKVETDFYGLDTKVEVLSHDVEALKKRVYN